MGKVNDARTKTLVYYQPLTKKLLHPFCPFRLPLKRHSSKSKCQITAAAEKTVRTVMVTARIANAQDAESRCLQVAVGMDRNLSRQKLKNITFHFLFSCLQLTWKNENRYIKK